MLVVEEVMTKAVQRAFDKRAEWPAVAEFRRYMPMANNTLRKVRTIASWRRSPNASPA